LGEKIGSTLLVPLDDAITDYYLVLFIFCWSCLLLEVCSNASVWSFLFIIWYIGYILQDKHPTL